MIELRWAKDSNYPDRIAAPGELDKRTRISACHFPPLILQCREVHDQDFATDDDTIIAPLWINAE